MNTGCNISSVNSYATRFSDYKQIELIMSQKRKQSFYDTTVKQRKGFRSKLCISQNFNNLRDLRIGSECNRVLENSNYDYISLNQLHMLDLIYKYHKLCLKKDRLVNNKANKA